MILCIFKLIFNCSQFPRRKTVGFVLSTASNENRKLSHSLTTQIANPPHLDSRSQVKKSQVDLHIFGKLLHIY